MLESMRSTMVSGCARRDSGTGRRYLLRPEHLDVTVADLPTGEEPTDQGVFVQPDVPLGQPPEHPPEGEVVQIAEGPSGHPVPKVIAPAPQHRIDPAQQVGERFDGVPGGTGTDHQDEPPAINAALS